MNGVASWILYAIFLLGGAGLYLAMPQAGKSTRVAGTILGVGALAGLIAFLAGRWGTADASTGYTLLFAAVAILSSARVITHRKPVYSAVYFVLTVVAVAMMMVLQAAEFLAVALIIVYAGAILVTYVFVIMLAQQGTEAGYDQRSREPLGAVFISFLLAAAVAGQVADMPTSSAGPREGTTAATRLEAPAAAEQKGNTVMIGEQLLTRYVVALELAGILLLVAMVGAIALAKRGIPPDPYALPETPLGEIGKQVQPF